MPVATLGLAMGIVRFMAAPVPEKFPQLA